MFVVFLPICVVVTKIVFGCNFEALVKKLWRATLSYALIIDLVLYVVLKQHFQLIVQIKNMSWVYYLQKVI